MSDSTYFDNLSGQTRKQCAEKYRELILKSELGEKIDWSEINRKIIERWSMAGLEFIKYNAFVRKTASGRTLIVARRLNAGYEVVRVSMNDFWGTLRAGFNDINEANNHCKNVSQNSK